MSSIARALGVMRSLAIYYGIPFRARRLRAFYAQFVDPGALCFDVGAHAGNRVRAWRKLGARVVAIEPQPQFVRLLRQLFGADREVEIVPAALGRASGSAELLISERTPTVSTLSTEWVNTVQTDPGFKRVRWTGRERVPVLTLDELIGRCGVPQFVKIDVEGYEAEVLGGLTTPLEALSFEYLPAARQVALECIDRLEQLGRYEYNCSPGERHRFVTRGWESAGEMRARLEAMPHDAPSGDVYARLV